MSIFFVSSRGSFHPAVRQLQIVIIRRNTPAINVIILIRLVLEVYLKLTVNLNS